MSLDGAGKVLLIGLDSADEHHVKRYLPHMPNLRELFGGGEFHSLETTATVMDASVWRTFSTGTPPGEHGAYFPFQWDARRMRYRRIDGYDWLPFKPFWDELADKGLNVGIFDVPMLPLPTESAANVSTYHWHTQEHGNLHAFNSTSAWKRLCASEPANKLGYDIPVDHSPNQLRAIHKMVIDSIRQRSRMTRRLIENTDWHLFALAFSEIHRAGHYFCADPDSPQFERQDAELRAVYRVLDEEIGEILSSVDTERVGVGIFSLHGMGPNVSQTHFLPHVLHRFSAAYVGGAPDVVRAPGIMRRLREKIPPVVQNRIAYSVNQPIRDWVVNRQWAGGFDWPKTWAFTLLSGGQGYIRWNRKGREASGVFDPGEPPHREFVDALKNELHALRRAHDGRKIVREIIDVQATCPGVHADKLPDLSVIWDDLAPAREIESPNLGEFRGRIMTGRGGNHRANAFLALSRTAAQRSASIGKPKHIVDLGSFVNALATAQ